MKMFRGEIGKTGTHWGRIGSEDYFYNGFKRSDFSMAYGLERLGVENVGAFFPPVVFW